MHCASNVNKVFSAQKKDKIIRKRKSIYRNRNRYIERDSIMWRLSSEMHDVYSKNLIYVMYANRKCLGSQFEPLNFLWWCMKSVWFLLAKNAKDLIPIVFLCVFSNVYVLCWFAFVFKNQLESKKNENKNTKKKCINSHRAC